MLIGSIYGWEIGKDDLFDPLSIRNRDDCLEPMRELQKYALSKGIELHTADIVKSLGLSPSFNLYVESIPVDRSAPGKNYLFLFETHLTVPLNSDCDYLNQFDEIFTWDIDLLKAREAGVLNTIFDHVALTEIRIPNPIPQEFFTGDLPLEFAKRPQFCCMIASNRHANQFDVRELYSERVRAIRWFEKNAPHQFYLYGNGWKVPKKRLGRIGKMIYRLEKVIPFLTRRPVFPSYQGPTLTKLAALSKTRFCICFENARDISGYLTEKIFDCFFAGCVPVYFGEPNIQNWIPPECFVDFRNFNSYEDLYQYLNNMPESEFISMQNAARKFVCSDSFAPHSSQSFASKVIDRIYERIA
jgi:hypothetical protein